MYYYVVAGKMEGCPSNQLGVLSVFEHNHNPFEGVEHETHVIYNWVYHNTNVSTCLRMKRLEQLPAGISFYFKGAEVVRSMTIQELDKRTPTTYYLFRVKK